MQEETNDENPFPGESGTSAPALSPTDTPEAVTSEVEAGDRGRVSTISRKRPEPQAARAVHTLQGIAEPLRGEDGSLNSFHFGYSVGSSSARKFQEMVAKGQYARDPLQNVPFPTGKRDYGTTGALIARIKLAIAEQTQLSDANCALLTYWVLSTWFQDAIPVAPGLAITGWAYEGDIVLRTLKAFCYHPHLSTTSPPRQSSWARTLRWYRCCSTSCISTHPLRPVSNPCGCRPCRIERLRTFRTSSLVTASRACHTRIRRTFTLQGYRLGLQRLLMLLADVLLMLRTCRLSSSPCSRLIHSSRSRSAWTIWERSLSAPRSLSATRGRPRFLLERSQLRSIAF